jgi:C-terminal processing protease CtpA/Prc
MESQIAETLGVKKAFDDSFNREQLLKAQLATLQSKYEVINQKASDVESAGYQLLDTMSGHAVERKGVGMVLRIENSKSHGEYEVKQLIAGGSASKSSIKVSDTVLEVDGHPISDLSIEHVTDLILGPQGTTVTITGMTSGARYSETLVRGETRHTRPFADEAKEAIDALQRTNQEAKDAKTACKSLEDQLTAAKSKMKELENKLETLTSSASRDKEQSKSMAEQVSSLTKQLEAFELQLKQAENSNVHLQAKLVGVNDALSRSDNDVKIERAASQKASSELKAVLDELSRMKLKLQSFSQSSEAEISKLKERLEASEGDVLRLTKKSNSLAKENGLSAGKLAEAQEAFYATTEALRGQYMQHCGVGMIVRVEDRNRCTITSLTPGGPAAVSGVLECGDAILKINGNDVQGMPLSLVQEQIIGAAGTIVILAGLHTNAEPFTVELVRGTNDMRQSLSVIELTQSNITTAKGMHKEIARLSRVYAEAQKTIQTLREEAEYAARREQALRLAMRDVEHDRVSTTGSLQSRMAEIELIRNDLQEREMRLAAAHEQCKKEKSRREEFEAANARLSKQIQDLHGDLEQQLRESKRLDTLLGTRCAELKDVTAERDATLGVLHGAQHEKQDLHAQVADLKRQVETNRQKLVLAASARQDLDGMRKIKYEELQMLKESSLSALQNLTDAEKDLAAIKQSAEDQRALYANNVGIYQASLAKEREMTTAIEKQLEMAKVEVTACRRLLELMRGYVGERKGVGMLVRTHPQKRGHYSVKEMVEGGSAALSNRISIGDTLLAVDDNEVTGLSIDDVQNLIVGPEGSAVTIKCHSEKGALNSHESDDMEHNGFFSPRGIQNLLTFRPRPNSTKGTAYTVTLLRGDWAQADNLLHETEVACDRVRSIHAENTEAKKLIGNLLLEAKQRQVALVEARRALNIMCQDVNIPLKETQKYFNVDDYFDDSSTDVQMNASTFVRLDSAVQFELDSMRKKSSDLLSDILKKAYSGLQCYKEQTEFSGELKRKLMTAESRNEHQSGTISDMKEKLAKTEVLLKSSQQEVDELRATVSKMDKDIAVLKADKNEKTAMLVDLKDQLAKVLEHKCAIQAEKDGLVARSRTLENQLGEAELLAAQRGTAISEMQVSSWLLRQSVIIMRAPSFAYV